jgi:cell division protein FtsW (lipid II flippase)
MKRLLAILLIILCFGLAMPLVDANPIPLREDPVAFFFWILPNLSPILAFFTFLIIIAYYMNKISKKKQQTGKQSFL